MANMPIGAERNKMIMEPNETKAIIEIANRKLLQSNPDHQWRLFNNLYRVWVWGDMETGGWNVSLQSHDGADITRSVTVLNSEIATGVKPLDDLELIKRNIATGVKMLDDLELIKRNNNGVAKAFAKANGDELRALRLAVISLAKEADFWHNILSQAVEKRRYP